MVTAGPLLRCGLGGVALGLATLATFSFVGVPIVPTEPPALRDALLGAADLPPGFLPVGGPAIPPGAGCAGLLTHPTAGWPGTVERDQRQAATGSRLWEAVAAPAGDALTRLHDRLVACSQAGVREMAPPVPDGYAFTVSVGGLTGYLAAGQVGAAALVLRFLTSSSGAATSPEAVTVTLHTALGKLSALSALVSVTGGPPR
jgi:hypothetical protein